MIKNSIIKNLLNIVEESIKHLKEKQKLSLKKYLQSWEDRSIVEREFQKAIQSCIDIGARLISQKNFRKPDDYHGIFDVLFQEKVISQKMKENMNEMVGFRNALVHEYREIEHNEVYRHLHQSLNVLRQFASSIITFLE